MHAWTAPEVPRLPVTAPPVRVHDTATGALVSVDPGRRAGSALRLRHHAVRRHPPRPRRHLHRLRPPGPGLARGGARRHLRAERHRRRRPAARARHQGRGRLGRAGRARDRAVPAGHGRPAGAPARPLHRSGRVDPARRRPGPAARGDRLRLPRRRRPLLLRDRRRRVRRGVGLGPRADAGDLRGARGRPRARRQEGPARLRAVARRATGRARVGQRLSGEDVPAGTSSAPRSRWSTSARRSTSRAAAATWCSRTTRCAPRRPRWPSPGTRSPGPTCTPAWSATTARRCRSRAGTWSSSARCATATSTRWRSGWRCCATTTGPTGSGPTPSCGRRSTRFADWRRALALGAGAPAEPVVHAVLAALADDLDAPTALAAVDTWVAATSARRAGRHQRPRGRSHRPPGAGRALGLSL